MDVEMDIDPLSMLEQSMQVNEGTALSSNTDEDCVVVEDGEEEEQTSRPGPSFYQLNGNSVVPTTQEPLVPNVPLSLQQEDALNFGEHFLAGHVIDYNTLPPGSPNCTERSPTTTDHMYVGKEEGRGRRRGVPRGGKLGRGGVARRGKVTNQIFLVSSNVLQLHGQDKATKVNAKLVTNIKRLSIASSEELSYRHKVFTDLSKVLNGRLDCTVCGQHIGCSIMMNIFLYTHPLLKVLTCMKCSANYSHTDWTVGLENKDMKCRWCSKQPSLKSRLCNCTNCPFGFCENCIVHNFSRRDYNRISRNENWLCFVCQMVPLFFMRATCWALQMFIASLSRRKMVERYKSDMSKCCKEDVIDLMDETDTADSSIGNEVNGDEMTSSVSTLPVSSRVDLLFSGIDNIKHSVKTRLNTPVVASKVDSLVSDLNLSLAKIGTNLESCLDYIKNWRNHTVKTLREQGEATDRNIPKEVTRRKINGKTDFSPILKKFNIKPCRVILKRLDPATLWTETSEPPSFFLSLVPNKLSSESPKSKGNIDITEDTDDDIICLDD